jgi:hypothetical protein
MEAFNIKQEKGILMSLQFIKFYPSILDSSLWDEPAEVTKVFQTFWSKSDFEGNVNATYNSLYRSANLRDFNGNLLSIELFDRCIEKLLSPDKNSRSPEEEGRRIIRIGESNWKITNFKKYHNFTYSDNPNAVKVRRWREEKKKSTKRKREKEIDKDIDKDIESKSYIALQCNHDVVDDNKNQCFNDNEKQNWRTDFNIYISEARAAFDNIIKDSSWQEVRQRYHPGLNILLSCEKMFQDFWGTEAGWKHKKRSKTKVIDWVGTINNGLSLKSNQVWQDRNGKNKQSANAIGGDEWMKIHSVQQ